MSRLSESLFGVIENRISPLAGRLSSQRHVIAIREEISSRTPTHATMGVGKIGCCAVSL